jgi:hypothetical protein
MTDANPNTQAAASGATVTEYSPATSTPDGGTAHATRDGAGAVGIAPERARELRQRWSELKGEFVDNPRSAAGKARDVAGEVLDELERALRHKHGTLGDALESDPKTEDLRVTLNRYQEFSERLLSF